MPFLAFLHKLAPGWSLWENVPPYLNHLTHLDVLMHCFILNKFLCLHCLKWWQLDTCDFWALKMWLVWIEVYCMK
jgi:hypothetical protein